MEAIVKVSSKFVR